VSSRLPGALTQVYIPFVALDRFLQLLVCDMDIDDQCDIRMTKREKIPGLSFSFATIGTIMSWVPTLLTLHYKGLC
jgi:hypothetical protein